MIEQFRKDVIKGLSSDPKTLPSKYFYDKKGDELFVKIMNLPEYYLTRAEFEIFSTQTNQIIHLLEIKKDEPFQLIELGAGNGSKTKELLKALIEENYSFEYHPIDISQNALNGLEINLSKELPELVCCPKQGEYFQILEKLKSNDVPKIILFLGSNIGNMLDDQAHSFVYQLGASINKGDKLLLGVDLIKSKKIVFPAYNDSKGITAEFNLNLLDRINEDLKANFVRDNFTHSPEYDEKEGVAKSYIESTCDQKVYLANSVFHFQKGEKIHTEISRKYDDTVVQEILHNTDFGILSKLTDSNNYFADYILERG